MQCVILAGGLGTRMQGVAKGLPKSLIPIGDLPFLHYQLTWLGRQGVTEVVLCVGYGAEAIERYATDGRPWGLQLTYVNEGDILRGTGGALRNANDKGKLKSEFFVLYGDSFLPIDISPVWAYFQKRKESALMVVLKNEGRWDKSNVSFDGELVTRYDKHKADPGMLYIDYGLSILRRTTIERDVPREAVYDLADLYLRLSEQKELAGYETRKRFFEIGSLQGLEDLSSISKQNHSKELFMGFPTLKIAVFADGANIDAMVKRYNEGFVKGFTTNPTLMAKAGITDYEKFARSILETIKTLPISFEVFSDEFIDMERQALKIKAWGANVNVKIPITNTRKESALPLIRRLFDQGLKLNITAIQSDEQILGLSKVLKPEDDVIVSIFAGRIADTGRDPIPAMTQAVKIYQKLPKAKVLWASPREVLNIYQAQACGCQIITATDDLIAKLALHMKPLDEYSLDTVKMFHADAQKAGFKI